MTLKRLKGLDKFRGILPLPFLIIAFFYMRDKFVLGSMTIERLVDLAGLISILMGEAIRAVAIAAGSRGVRNGNEETKTRRLLVSGVYAYTRNPRYLGNFFICLGFAAVFSNLYLAVVSVLGFWLITYAVVASEEKFLSKTFEAEYDKYRETVPRFFLSFKSNQYKAIPWEKWSWKRFFRKEQNTYSTVLLLWCACELVKEIKIKGAFDVWFYLIGIFSACIIVQWFILTKWKKGWLDSGNG
ncbi:MAG TPA: methyltransferase family protein [Candidatus Hypogeohydataceae bacterium YC40]